MQRYFSLWFRQLTTDWLTLKRPALQNTPVVFVANVLNKKVITAANAVAQSQGVVPGMVVADARVLVPGIEIIDDRPDLGGNLLHALGLWCIRYTPIVSVDPPDGLLLDISGCAHLWGGERGYLKEIVLKLRGAGYDVRGAIADTVGAAWAWARFGKGTPILESAAQQVAMAGLSPAALRLESSTLARLRKLGFRNIDQIVRQPRSSLPSRFGKELLVRLDQAFGKEEEKLQPLRPVEPYQERLPCLEPIRTAGGIEIALARLLDGLCRRLYNEGKGVRTAVLTCFRVDGKLQHVTIGTNKATANVNHLFKLFEGKIPDIEPDLGIEVFLLEAPKVEPATTSQETLWGGPSGIESGSLAELLDRITNKIPNTAVHRFLPAEHYWPERSVTPAPTLWENGQSIWEDDKQRPVHLLHKPEPIQVTAPIPDYPPMNFRYNNKLHTVVKADGPERIENEWWIEEEQHRDYYILEDEAGARYWVFRAGHYDEARPVRWFLHGFFA